ncbi:MAG: DUF5394 family protein [Rickettsiaceae bacterium]
MKKNNNSCDKSNKNKSEQHESEMLAILEELQKDSNVGKAIDQIIEEAAELDEIQSKLILLIKKHLSKIEPETDQNTGAKIKLGYKEMEENITKFTHDLLKSHQDNNPDISNNSNNKYFLDKQAKMNIKKSIKEFAVYEIYKVMNPRRIAGETKKDNYAHNMMMGGKNLASKYEGGQESDLKSYGEKEVRCIEHASKSFQKNGGGMSI